MFTRRTSHMDFPFGYVTGCSVSFGFVLTVLFLVPAEPRDELRQVYCRVFKVGSKTLTRFGDIFNR